MIFRRLNRDIDWGALRPWHWLLIALVAAGVLVNLVFGVSGNPWSWLLIVVFAAATLTMLWFLPGKTDRPENH